MVALMFNFTFRDEKVDLIICSSYQAFLCQLMSWISLSLWVSFSERGLLSESRRMSLTA